MVKAGLTGGIASGKTQASKLFAAAGATIVDADILSRRCMELPAVQEALRAAFPQAYLEGALDRRCLRRIVFEDEAQLKKLNAITHPPIRQAAEEALKSSNAPVTILVAPLLFEAGLDDLVHPIAVITCREETRIARLMQRDTISEALARRMIAAQMREDERIKRADAVIVNDGDISALAAKVQRLYREWA